MHVHRQVCTWLGKKPKSLVSIELKEIVHQLPRIETHNDRLAWQRGLNDWLERDRDFVYEKTLNVETGKKWYTHKQLHQSASLILGAMPNLFHYLDNAKVPKTTNGLESFFGHLKDNLSIHRGTQAAVHPVVAPPKEHPQGMSFFSPLGCQYNVQKKRQWD